MRNLKNLTIAALLSTSINFALGSEFDLFEEHPNGTTLRLSYNQIKNSTKGRGLLIKQKLMEENLFEVMGGDPDKEISFTGLLVDHLVNRTALDLAFGELRHNYLNDLIFSNFMSLDEIARQDLKRQKDALREALPPLHKRGKFGKRERDENGDPIIISDHFMYDISRIDLDKATSHSELRSLVEKINARKEPVTIARGEYKRLKALKSQAVEEATRRQEVLDRESIPDRFVSDLIRRAPGLLNEMDVVVEEGKAVVLMSLFTKIIREYKKMCTPETFLAELLVLSRGNVGKGDLGPIIDPPFDNITHMVQMLLGKIEKVRKFKIKYADERNRAKDICLAIASGEFDRLVDDRNAKIEELSAQITSLRK